MKTIISFVLCCEIQFLKYQLRLRTGWGGDTEHPLHGLLICATAPCASAAQGRTQRKPSASRLIKDPDCQSYEKQLRKELGEKMSEAQGKKKKRKKNERMENEM